MSGKDDRPAPAAGDERVAVQDILAGEHVRSLFQPIVELVSGAVVGYEALTRGPAGPLQAPDELFGAARRAGLLAELDQLCASSAVRCAATVGIGRELSLFVNVEPETIDVSALRSLARFASSVADGPQLVLEVTERALVSRPAQLLRAARLVRACGWRIALDDVGADDQSLTFMALLRPDIIKLDMQLVQSRPDPTIARVVAAVGAQAQHTGCLVVAEGIENDDHLAAALAMGATLGQGYKYGRPQADISRVSGGAASAALPGGATTSEDTPLSPFDALPPGVPLRRSAKPLLVQISRYLEYQAARLGGSTGMLVSVFQEAEYFTPATASRYRALAGDVGYIAAMVVEQAGPAAGEWIVAVLSPHYAAALLARDLNEGGDESNRMHEFVVTYDRDIVSRAIETLLCTTAPQLPATSQPVARPALGPWPRWLFAPLFQGATTRAAGLTEPRLDQSAGPT